SATASGVVSSPEKAAGAHDFSGGESKMSTPLPPPSPGMGQEEFKEESTRVMQDEMVQALADKTRSAPLDDFGDEPTRRATQDQANALKESSAARAGTSQESKPASEPQPPAEAKIVLTDVKP